MTRLFCILAALMLLAGCANDNPTASTKTLPAPCDNVLFYPERGGYIVQNKTTQARKYFSAPTYRDPYNDAVDYARRNWCE